MRRRQRERCVCFGMLVRFRAMVFVRLPSEAFMPCRGAGEAGGRHPPLDHNLTARPSPHCATTSRCSFTRVPAAWDTPGLSIKCE